MPYIHIATGKYPAHPSESMPWKDWPEIIPIETYRTLGYEWVFPTPKPEGAVEGQPRLTDKGHWEQTWSI